VTEQDWLNAIKAEPDNDLPRLAYADWLDERGHEGDADRAMFVRVQCRLAALRAGARCHQPGAGADDGCDDSDCPRCGPERDLFWLERELWERVGCWGLPVGVGSNQATWRRGFIDEVELPAGAWARHGDEILSRHPVARVVLLEDPEALREQMARWEAGDRSDDGDPAWRPIIDRDPALLTRSISDPAAMVELLRLRWPDVRDWRLPRPEGAVGALVRGMTGR
jgi:uncharacterized protein (TIGR02996 family)